MMAPRTDGDITRNIFLVATEESGDRLGASLMKVLRPRHAQLCRPRAGAAAVRAGGACAARRPALQLCRPSLDRADRGAAALGGRKPAPWRAAALAAGAARQPAQRDQTPYGGIRRHA